jgi:competence protein ComEC
MNRSEEAGGTGCHSGQAWIWDGVVFRVLHPSKWLPYLGNDSSCVISVDNGRHRTLLSGDISTLVEDRIAPDLERHHLLTVPHHGSASSSGVSLIAAAQPHWAIASAAYDNRFGFPRPEVIDRYQRKGSTLLSTIDCGALKVTFPDSGEAALEAARHLRSGPWRQGGNARCMASTHPAMYHLSRPKKQE